MAYENFTSTLTCTFCGDEFETKNVRMKRILCDVCRPQQDKIMRYAGDRSLSSLGEQTVKEIYKDKTVRYGLPTRTKK